MRRLSTPWLMSLSCALIWVSGCTTCRQNQACYAPSVLAPPGDTAPRAFVGSAYDFRSPGSASNYPPAVPHEPNYSDSLPYVQSYYGPFARSAARTEPTRFYEPGPYFYTPAQSYTPEYYGYYYGPGFYRY